MARNPCLCRMEWGQIDRSFVPFRRVLYLFYDDLSLCGRSLEGIEQNRLINLQDFLAGCKQRCERIKRMPLIGKLLKHILDSCFCAQGRILRDAHLLSDLICSDEAYAEHLFCKTVRIFTNDRDSVPAILLEDLC